MKNLAAAIVLASAAAGAACGGGGSRGTAGAAPGAAALASESRPSPGGTGTIRGVVRLRGAVPAPAFQPVDKDRNICGTQVPVTRLALGAGGGVQHAFVYLENAPATGTARPRESVPVAQRGCEYGPHAMTVQAGTRLDIANDDPILHNVHARRMTPDGLQTIFNIAQPVRGQRTVVEPPLTSPGIVALTCEAGHPWMTAYVLVANHPYTAVTNADGTFTISDVPAGSYRIRMWHEGVRLTQVLKSVQQYEFEAPYEAVQEVAVAANGGAQVDFEFELRRDGQPAN
jgi:plastocyanin